MTVLADGIRSGILEAVAEGLSDRPFGMPARVCRAILREADVPAIGKADLAELVFDAIQEVAHNSKTG